MVFQIGTVFIGLIFFLYGILFFAYAVKRNANLAEKFFTNTIGGIIAGIIVAMFLSFEGQMTSETWIVLFGSSMLLIGIISQIMTWKGKK